MQVFLILTLIGSGCSSQNQIDKKKVDLNEFNLDTFPMTASIRAIETIDENTVWFAGSNGQYGYTKNGGKNWMIDSMVIDSLSDLQFRSIAVTEEAVFILSISTPALFFKSVNEGSDWDLVYRENHPKAFYDAMAFWDETYGIAMGDPTEDCISIILTKDGGNHWNKIECSKLPQAMEGEAAFAASNSNIALSGDYAWIVTGGSASRVFHTPDRGESWEVFDTPIVSGGQMTGVYSVDFYDGQNGIIFGGDWNDKASNRGNKAITRDGGKSWDLVSDGVGPGYRSCVQYLPGQGPEQIIAVGSPGISFSQNGGKDWKMISEEGFYTVRVIPTGGAAWLAGDKKIALMTW